MKRTAITLPRWHRLWMIGWQQHRDGDEAPPDPPAELARWREAGNDAEHRLWLRAQDLLGQKANRLAVLPARLGWGLAAVCALVGLGAALGVWGLLGPGTQPVNVVWTWIALLGPHLLMFALWLLGLGVGGSAPWSGRGLAALGQRVPGLLPDRAALDALWDGLRQVGAGRWMFSLLSHLVWLSALGGALVGLLLALALRRYGFTWETTILPAAWFETLVRVLAWLPGLFGLPQPDAALVSASGDAPVVADSARRAWSYWLVGGLLVYGLLPRALALLFCRWRLHRALQRLRVPWERPYYAVLQRRLMPRNASLGVLDADQSDGSVEQWVLGGVGEGTAVVGLDLPPDWRWPPMAGADHDLGRCESREQRAKALEQLTDSPAAKLLVVVEAAQSPDRGSLRWIGELAGHCRQIGLLLAGTERDERHELWRGALRQRGLPQTCIFGSDAAAAGWLAEARP